MKSKYRRNLDLKSLIENRCALCRLQLTITGNSSGRNTVFTVKPLHLVHLGICEKLKECTAAYWSSNERLINVLIPKRHIGRRKILKTTMLLGCNKLLAAYEKDLSVPGMQVKFLTSQISESIYRPFRTSVLKELRKGQNYSNVVTVFPFQAECSDRKLENF